jgi:hypothetical protein
MDVDIQNILLHRSQFSRMNKWCVTNYFHFFIFQSSSFMTEKVVENDILPQKMGVKAKV